MLKEIAKPEKLSVTMEMEKETEKEGTELPRTPQPTKKPNKKLQVLFENYGLEFLPSKNEGLDAVDENEEDDGKEEREIPFDEEIDSKQLLQIVLVNYRLSNVDGIPQVIPGFDYLAIGSIGAAYNYENLVKYGITHILCLSEVIKLRFPQIFQYKRVCLSDKPRFDITPYLEECYLFINEAKHYRDPETGKPGRILVHCYQGISRSTTICCAYMIRYGNLKRDQALELIRSVRPKINPNSGFMSLLKSIEKEQELIEESKKYLELSHHDVQSFTTNNSFLNEQPSTTLNTKKYDTDSSDAETTDTEEC
jgi:hypothetical protein